MKTKKYMVQCHDICRVFAAIAIAVGFTLFFSLGAAFFLKPSIIYKDVIVNVEHINNTVYTFYGRCDYFNEASNLGNLLIQCGTKKFQIEPCHYSNHYPPNGKYYQNPVYEYGQMKCPTHYLAQFKGHVNVNVNLVTVIGVFMFIIATAFLIGGLVFFKRCRRRQRYQLL